MKTPPSAKAFFRARQGRGRAEIISGSLTLAEQENAQAGLAGGKAGQSERNALDFYPTTDLRAIRGLLARDGARIRSLGAVWEPAAGLGHMAREIEAFGVPCIMSDIADHGCPGVEVRDFYDFDRAPAPAIVTNPPYAEINSHGRWRWLEHTLAMPGWRYCALLLNWQWPAAAGLGRILDRHPFSYCYLLRWRLDFSGEKSPPHQHAWFVWDRDWIGAEPAFRFMDRTDGERLVEAELFA